MEQLKELIHRDWFEIRIQAIMNGRKIIAKERIRPYNRQLLEKKILCHGHSGDPERWAKVKQMQKDQEKQARLVGNVKVPAEAFLAMTKTF